MRLAGIVTAVALLGIGGAQSVTISGRVADRVTGEPIAGVIASALDARGQVVARVVTDRSTGFRLVVSAPPSQIQLRKIGYSAVVVPFASIQDGRVDVTMQRLPTQLPPVKAVGYAPCDPRPDREAALSMWEEVRAGVLASIVARESRAARFTVLGYNHQVFSDGKSAPQRVTRVQADSASRVFVAVRTARELARHGYIDKAHGGSYLAPDDVVLADESFLLTHCFSLATPAAGDDSTLGVLFEPARENRKNVDVAGVVWLRKNPLDIRSVEFTYVNLDRKIKAASPGGRIEFSLMPNGITMLSQWKIRAAFEARSIVHIDEAGAVIEYIEWPGSAPWGARLSTVSGKVLYRGGRPAADVLVRLDRTPFVVRTDSAGAFTISGIPPGFYRVMVGDPRLTQMRIVASESQDIDIPVGAAVIAPFEIESPDIVAARACEGRAPGRHAMRGSAGSEAILGQVTAPGFPSGPRFRAKITVVGPNGVPWPDLADVETDDFGRFRICGLTSPVTVTITAKAPRGATGSREVILPAGGGFVFTTIEVKAGGESAQQPPP